ncbi:MAG: sporulation transcription factor Spo0A [Clostridia bacterium]|nr:sporulation transcription factor Spo0A [Clostridia bacterium]
MKDEISVLIADDNIDFGNLLNEYMQREEDIRVVGVARDGLQAYDMITTLKPDVVVLDIIMPNLDGIGVLEKISLPQSKSYKPVIIMLSAIGQDMFIQKAIALGAEYYVVKPFDVDILVSRIRQVYKEKHTVYFTQNTLLKNPALKGAGGEPGNNLEAEVTNLMRDVGISPHMTGYQYIREAIIQSVNNSKAFTSVTKVLYPSVAMKFSSTPQKVERAIRNAIETAWSKGNNDSMDSLFGYTVNYDRGKPTNSEFIAMMADKVRISIGLK